MTAALALGLGAYWERWTRRGRTLAGIAATALLLTNLQLPINTASVEIAPEEQSWLRAIADRAQPGDVVLNMPSDCLGQMGRQAVWQMYHKLPFVGCQGYTAQLPVYSGMDAYLTESMAAVRCMPSVFSRRAGLPFASTLVLLPDDISRLRRDLGVRFVVIDKVALGELPECREGRLNGEVDGLRTWYSVVGESTDILVLDTEGSTASDPVETSRSFVMDVYQVLVGRDPSSEELARGMATLDLTGNHGDMIDEVRSFPDNHDSSCSAEVLTANQDDLAAATRDLYDEAFVWISYRALLGREPDGGGWESSLAFLNGNPAKRLPLLESIRRSDEFRTSVCGDASRR
jgi:hypothetical protein